jgi:hypothetical protein
VAVFDTLLPFTFANSGRSGQADSFEQLKGQYYLWASHYSQSTVGE